MSNITPGHVLAFQALKSGALGEVTLASCTINGEHGVAIIALEHVGEGKVAVAPLWVAILPSMEIDFPDYARRGGSGDGGGGPERSTKQEFAINKDQMFGPQP